MPVKTSGAGTAKIVGDFSLVSRPEMRARMHVGEEFDLPASNVEKFLNQRLENTVGGLSYPQLLEAGVSIANSIPRMTEQMILDMPEQVLRDFVSDNLMWIKRAKKREKLKGERTESQQVKKDQNA